MQKRKLLSEPREEFTTIYLTPAGFEKAQKEAERLEKAAEGRDVGYGDNYINVYSTDPKIIGAVVDLIGKKDVLSEVTT